MMTTNSQRLALFFLLSGIVYSGHAFKFLAPQPTDFFVDISFGSELKMNCTTDDPTATTSLHQKNTVTWRKLKSSEYTKVGDVYTIKINIMHSGRFKCQATNPTGSTIYWPNTVGLAIIPFLDKTPELSVSPNHEQVISRGETVNFTCTAASHADLQWFKIGTNGKESTVTTTVTTTVGASKKLVMVINNAQKDDSGFYRCSMNDGYRYRMASLKVYGGDSPRIISHSGKSGEIVVKRNTNVTIECIAHGYPKPLVKWYKDNQEVNVPGCLSAVDFPDCVGVKYTFTSSSLTSTKVKSVMTIHKFNEDEASHFSCQAVNKFGRAYADITIVPDSIFRFLQPKPKGIAMITVDFESTLTIDCTTNDRNALTSLYHRSSSPWKMVPNSKAGKSKSVYTVTKDFSIRDSGFYKCIALNSSGYEIEWPSATGLFVVPDIIRAPKVSVSPRYEQYMTVGDSLNFTCKSEGRTKLKWYQEMANKTFKLVPGSMTYKTKPSQYHTEIVLMIKDAKVSDAGFYKCVMKYRTKTVSNYVSLKVFENSKKKPTIISHTGQNGPVNIKSGVRLECVVESYPNWKGTMRWYKQGQEITVPGCTVARDLKSCDSSKHRLRLSSLTSTRVRGVLKIKGFDKQTDVGVYMCKAFNKFGEAMARMNVGV